MINLSDRTILILFALWLAIGIWLGWFALGRGRWRLVRHSHLAHLESVAQSTLAIEQIIWEFGKARRGEPFTGGPRHKTQTVLSATLEQVYLATKYGSYELDIFGAGTIYKVPEAGGMPAHRVYLRAAHAPAPRARRIKE